MTLNGYDISASQDGIDPAVVPCDFVQVKITGGDGYVNPNWQDEVAKVRAAGKLLGIYHFARDGYTNATAHSEAQWFLQHAAGLIDGTVIVVLDWEADNVTDVAYAKAWLDEVAAATGVKPLIYVSFKDIEGADWTPVASANYGLWEAAYVLGYQRIYGYLPPDGRAPIPYWNTIAEWQYTSSGNIPGWPDNLDLDVFYGDASTWAAYAAKNGTNPQTTTVTPIQEDDLPFTADQIKELAYEGALQALDWKVDNTLGGKTSALDVARVFDQSRQDTIQGTATEVLNRSIDREGAGQSGATNVRAVVANVDAIAADLKAHTDTAVQGITLTLTDAQVTSLASQIAAKLPAGAPTVDQISAAVVTALGTKLKTA